jgi:hypothetical protein
MFSSMLARALALCCPVVVTAASFHIETDNVPAVPVARRRDPTVERWGLYELALSGPAAAPTVSAGTGTGSAAAVSAQLGVVANPFEVELTATFTEQTTTKMQQLHVAGFFDGGTSYRVRFSPPTEGDWCWQTTSSEPSLDGHHGCLQATPPSAGNHGPVQSRGYSLIHADGTPHYSSGTTCYQWASKSFEMQNQTLATLRDSGAFNKIRMTVFPKWYVYNHANPVETGAAFQVLPGSPAANGTLWGCVGTGKPCSRRLEGSFDLRRFNVSFWQNYERLLLSLGEMDIIADIIVFHPYVLLPAFK